MHVNEPIHSKGLNFMANDTGDVEEHDQGIALDHVFCNVIAAGPSEENNCLENSRTIISRRLRGRTAGQA
jgi:hypothetical protein